MTSASTYPSTVASVTSAPAPRPGFPTLIHAVGVRYSSPLPTSQSIAFLKLPGNVPAYSGVQNTTASADASSSRSAVTV